MAILPLRSPIRQPWASGLRCDWSAAHGAGDCLMTGAQGNFGIKGMRTNVRISCVSFNVRVLRSGASRECVQARGNDRSPLPHHSQVSTSGQRVHFRQRLVVADRDLHTLLVPIAKGDRGRQWTAESAPQPTDERELVHVARAKGKRRARLQNTNGAIGTWRATGRRRPGGAADWPAAGGFWAMFIRRRRTRAKGDQRRGEAISMPADRRHARRYSTSSMGDGPGRAGAAYCGCAPRRPRAETQSARTPRRRTVF